MKSKFLILLGLLVMNQTFAQEKILTMEDAILGYHLYPKNKYIVWQPNKDMYTSIEENSIVGTNAKTGKREILVSLEQLNQSLKSNMRGIPQFSWLNENEIAFQHGQKQVAYNIINHSVVATALPKNAADIKRNDQGDYAYTIKNNVFITTAQGKALQVTNDTNKEIVNGQTVSRSEFGIDGGLFWSPDGTKLAYYRKDESKVTNFPLLDITTRTGSLKNIKYPMAGMPSENITLGVYDIASGKTVFMDVTDFDKERYLTNITWSPDSKSIYIQVLNRAQNHMILNCYDAVGGQQLRTLFEEQADTYVEPQDKLVFLKKDPKLFIYRTNSRDGYFNLYLCKTSGEVVRNLTPVKADVQFVGTDDKNVYYTSAEVTPLDNHLFRVSMKGTNKKRLTTESGWHRPKMSGSMDYFIDEYSNLTTPRVISLKSSDGKLMKTLLNAENPMKDYKLGEISIGSVKGKDGVTEHYYRLVKPIDFDSTKKYPTIVYVYGGPHSQMVKNTWQAELRRWEMYMAQHGYVIYVMDNSGTSNRGKAYESIIHGQCGQQEMEDQLQGIAFLRTLPWVDMNRIGIHGWSYGGFMTTSLVTNYPEIFKVAVAGGPVIDWKWYEVMYGERYMGSPLTNKEGYEKVSLINKAKDLKSKLLICQGAIDNVVVWEHSLSFIRECIKNNVQVDYFPYPCAEHNVVGKDRIHLMQKVTNYFEDYLK